MSGEEEGGLLPRALADRNLSRGEPSDEELDEQRRLFLAEVAKKVEADRFFGTHRTRRRVWLGLQELEQSLHPLAICRAQSCLWSVGWSMSTDANWLTARGTYVIVGVTPRTELTPDEKA